MQSRNSTTACLRRLFSRGYLEALPRRDADRQTLFALGAWRLREAGAETEAAINECLAPWLASFCWSLNIDHVTFRRELVDHGYLGRTADGQRYWINGQRILQVLDAQALDVDPCTERLTVEREREARKQLYVDPSS